MRRAFLVAVAALVLMLAGAAEAHTGGGAAYSGKAGPFSVYAFDGRPAATPGEAEFRVVLHRDNKPVDGAEVTLSADLLNVPRQHLELTADSVANVYTYRLPDHGVVPWRVRLKIRSNGETGTADYEVHGTASPAVAPAPAAGGGGGGGSRAGLVVATLVAAAGLTTAVVVRRARTRGTGAS